MWSSHVLFLICEVFLLIVGLLMYGYCYWFSDRNLLFVIQDEIIHVFFDRSLSAPMVGSMLRMKLHQ